jgi:hypothetical protein
MGTLKTNLLCNRYNRYKWIRTRPVKTIFKDCTESCKKELLGLMDTQSFSLERLKQKRLKRYRKLKKQWRGKNENGFQTGDQNIEVKHLDRYPEGWGWWEKMSCKASRTAYKKETTIYNFCW